MGIWAIYTTIKKDIGTTPYLPLAVGLKIIGLVTHFF